MDAFDQIKTLKISQVLTALGIKFVRDGNQLSLMEGERITDGWKADDATGIVHDFARDRGSGDLVTFVQKYLGYQNKAQVVEWYSKTFGIKSEEFKKAEYQQPQTKPMTQKQQVKQSDRERIADKWQSLPNLNAEQREYVKSRGIDPDKISEYAKNNDGMIAVRVFDEEGILTLQNRSIKDKRFMIEPGTQSKGCFISNIDRDDRRVIVVEGMFDFLTLAQFNVNVVGMKSALDGSEVVRAFHDKGYEVTIVPDDDQAGKNMHELFSDIPHFWYDLSGMGVKDVNELFVKSEWGEGIVDVIRNDRKIAGPTPPKRDYEIIDYADSLVDGMDELNTTKIENVISWGVGDLDRKLGYLMPGQLVLIGGVTGSGKSTLVNEIAGNVSKQGIKVGRFVLEDRHQDRRKEDLYYEIGRLRNVRGDKNYPKHEFMANNVKDKDQLRKDMEAAKLNLVKKFSNIMDIKANTQERMKIDELGNLVKDFVAKGCKLIVIDHLHYFKIMGDGQRYDLLIENAMQYINAIARDYKVTVILVAHYKKINGARPDDESFKDSMSIAQVPNKVIHVHRDKMADSKGFTELIITKNREGWTGVIEMNFDTNTNTYSNLKSELQKTREDKAAGWL